MLILGLGAYAVWGKYQIQLSSQKIEELKAQNLAYHTELDDLKGITASTTENFNMLYSSLSSEKKNLEEKVTTLDRLTRLDPQLLKKYSKVYFLNENYTPSETQVIPAEYTANKKVEYRVHVDVVYFLEAMIDDAKKEGLNLRVVSAYRSFATQAKLKAQNKVTYGVNTANRFVAEQGYSEHQLGTTVDLTTPEIAEASSAFDNTKEFAWLKENAYKYGFILSYPKGNGYYAYESWHWRFVGKALALQLRTDNINFYNLDQRFIDEYLVNMFDR
jgi:LAS superfamily LD-carboxypeptidase LdcB